MDRLSPTIPHQILAYRNGSHIELALREAARLHSPAEPVVVRGAVLQFVEHVQGKS